MLSNVIGSSTSKQEKRRRRGVQEKNSIFRCACQAPRALWPPPTIGQGAATPIYRRGRRRFHDAVVGDHHLLAFVRTMARICVCRNLHATYIVRESAIPRTDKPDF